MQHFARSLLLALQFFTRIPLPASWARWAGFSTARMRAALVHMPAIEGAGIALRDGVIPPTLNLKNQDPEIDLDVVSGTPRPLPEGDIIGLDNSFGFGGHNVCLAFRRCS